MVTPAAVANTTMHNITAASAGIVNPHYAGPPSISSAFTPATPSLIPVPAAFIGKKHYTLACIHLMQLHQPCPIVTYSATLTTILTTVSQHICISVTVDTDCISAASGSRTMCSLWKHLEHF